MPPWSAGWLHGSPTFGDQDPVGLGQQCRAHLLPTRRLRGQPRVVKRKMSNFGVKTTVLRHWPQPTKPPAEAVTIRALPPPDP